MLAKERIKSVNREVSGLCLSFVLHGVVIGFYLLFLYQKPLEIIQGKTVVLEISNIERMAPKPSVPTPPTPVQEVKKIEPVKPKPIEKVKPLPKPMVRKEVLIPEPTREEVATASEPVSAVQPNITHEVSSITPTSTSAEPYEKTDFEIIRDKVLARLIYPSTARRMGWNGVVHVALLIDTDGKLVSATLHQSSGRSMLDDAALEAALKLRGDQLPKPKSLSTVILPIAFKLK